MPFKNPEQKKKWQKDYYHKKGLKQTQTDRARLNYWRKKFMKKFNCSLQDCEKFTEGELREQIKTEMCRI